MTVVVVEVALDEVDIVLVAAVVVSSRQPNHPGVEHREVLVDVAVDVLVLDVVVVLPLLSK